MELKIYMWLAVAHTKFYCKCLPKLDFGQTNTSLDVQLHSWKI